MEIRMPSKSIKGDYHTIKITMECDCVAGFYKVKKCKHIKEIEQLIRDILNGNYKTNNSI